MMMNYRFILYYCVALMVCTTGCHRDAPRPSPTDEASLESQIPSGVSWASLLRDAADFSTLTAEPVTGVRSVLFSSSAESRKVSLAHLAPEVLGDLDHGFFVRVEETNGYVDATLAEAAGAGVVTWIWSANPIGQALLYVDNNKTPVLQLPFSSLLAGSFLPVRYPYAALTAQGYNLHFPIIHTNSFKLVVRVQNRKELSSLFYHVAWNSLDSGQPIHPFELGSVQPSAKLLGFFADRFLKPSVPTNRCVAEKSELALEPGDGKVCFQSPGGGVIRSLDIFAENKAALADLWIEAYWDGDAQPSVSCPLSMLAGTSAQCENTTSLPCTLSGSRVTFRWNMPFGPASKLVCLNKGQNRHAVRIAVVVFPGNEGQGSAPLRFHANYTNKQALSLTARNIVMLGQIVGPGRIVGCSLRVDSRSDAWWGEGDEIIWLDRYDDPAWRGTGTEDYFGFAWCSDMTFDHPFRGQPRADGSRFGRRVAAMHRYHLLDRLSFSRFAKFEMEAWGLEDGYMDYETTLMWYSHPNRNTTDLMATGPERGR